jgi:hypothetical protein
MNTHETVNELVILKSAVAETRRRIYELERSLIDHMQGEEATRIPHPDYDVRLAPGKAQIDAHPLRSMIGELLSPEDLAAVFHEGEECGTCKGTGVRPAYVDGTQANRVRRYGAEYAAAIDAATVRGDPTLEIKPRKAGAK